MSKYAFELVLHENKTFDILAEKFYLNVFPNKTLCVEFEGVVYGIQAVVLVDTSKEELMGRIIVQKVPFLNVLEEPQPPLVGRISNPPPISEHRKYGEQ
jgi:hypothetical protein